MSPIRNKVLLGVILQQAGLVTAVRLKQALEQQKSDKKSNIGEILANRGDINRQTADFFAERWFKLVEEKDKQPIGQYLKQAGLLTDEQIQIILEEQKQTELKFGELAIAKGWLEQTTVDFFLQHLLKESNLKQKTEGDRTTNSVNSVFNSEQTIHSIPKVVERSRSSEHQEYSQKVHEGFLQIKRKLLKLEERSYSEAALKQVLLWTDGQSVLTQKLFELFSENTINLAPKQETEQIDSLVQSKFIDDWENNELGKHLRTIKDRLLNNQQYKSERLLKVYQEILSKTVPIDQSKEQQELFNMGLVVKQQQRLVVANRIYQSIFSYDWVSKQQSNRKSEDNFAISTSEKSTKANPVVSNSSKPDFKFHSSSNFEKKGEQYSVHFQDRSTELKTKPHSDASSLPLTTPMRDRSDSASAPASPWKTKEEHLLDLQSRHRRISQDDRQHSSRTQQTTYEERYSLGQQETSFNGSDDIYEAVSFKTGITATPRRRALASQPHPSRLPNSSHSTVSEEPLRKSIASQQQLDRTIQKANNNYFFQLKNILLLLAFVGLISLLFNNFAKQMAVRVAFWKGNQLLKQKLYGEAIAKYERLLEQDSNYYQAWTYRGYALAGLQKYREMHESCATATIIESKAVYAWNCRGEALYNLGRYHQAIAAFDRAIAINKTEPIFLINKSKAFKALGKNEESIVVIREAIKLLEQIEATQGDRGISNEFAVALTFLGNSYVHRQQEQAAIDSYTRALTYVPNYFPAQIGKGIALNMAKRYNQAQNEFNRILDNAMLTPTQKAQTLFYIGQTLCSSQQKLLGIATLEKASDLKSDYEITKRSLEKCT